ncbi:heparan-alpha-glucosaminide N-acetyltransferase-like isoform X2 [Xenia sp. Carnegie-2017]|uniref:heparan-alpha-glucosaminide N-acetyltransferase-like isoform X2 n=1 Tax=Xenia sp. Carnegie-2017 TaxID=2897299 RepID=UPI001F04B77E|nr:heparan-alpha-glucosaminide N-acetyltransferase-like isoform X2 [Xenia sp. Carnegie-2017]
MTFVSHRYATYFFIYHLLTGNGIFAVIDGNMAEVFHSPFFSQNSSPNQTLLPSQHSSFAQNEKKRKTDIYLGMDEAYLNVTSVDHSAMNETYEVYGVSDNCYKCPLQKLKMISNQKKGKGFIIDTRWPFRLHVHASSNINKNCSITFHFGESGHYLFETKVDVNNSLCCAMVVIKKPKNSFIPIFVAAGIMLGIMAFALLANWIRRMYLKSFHGVPYSNLNLSSFIFKDLGRESQTQSDVITHPTKKRLKSLDTFRGLSLTIMVFVNFGGGGYWFFQHSIWNGLTVADLVFPWFIFIMGVSLAVSFSSLRQKNIPKSRIFIKIVRRSLILFALGLLMNKGTDLSSFRIPGVLQRFAISYFVVASSELWLHYPIDDSYSTAWWFMLREIVELWIQWILMICIITLYCVLTYLVNVPNCPRGYVGPGGIGEGYPTYENCTGGMAGYIDRSFFGKSHIYQHPTSMKLYLNTIPYDPEGALGSLTSIFLTFLGLQAGKILLNYTEHFERERRLISYGLILGFIAIGLCGASKNDGLIPINKNLWSLSFVIANGSSAFILLTICYVLIDDRKIWHGSPFVFPGMNSILVYCGHEILTFYFPFNWELDKPTHSKKLAMNLWGASCWVIIAYYLYKINFFVKI